jgi:tetratricopeptide (TPR) repeat protein
LLIERDNSIALEKRAICYYRKGQHAEALADCTMAIELNPKSVDARYYRGLIRYESAKYNDAQVDFAEVVRLRPQHQPAWHMLGMAWRSIGVESLAIDAFDQALKLDPSDKGAKKHRELAKAEQLRAEEALAAARERERKEQAEALRAIGSVVGAALGAVARNERELEAAGYRYEKRMSSCSNCGGDGRVGLFSGFDASACPRCGGSGLHDEWSYVKD